MDILEYDIFKMKEDIVELRKINDELKEDTKYLVGIDKREFRRLMEVCSELDYLIGCMESSRDKYLKCEDKIEDLLHRLKTDVL